MPNPQTNLPDLLCIILMFLVLLADRLKEVAVNETLETPVPLSVPNRTSNGDHNACKTDDAGEYEDENAREVLSLNDFVQFTFSEVSPDERYQKKDQRVVPLH